jgi:hypothetical protein
MMIAIARRDRAPALSRQLLGEGVGAAPFDRGQISRAGLEAPDPRVEVWVPRAVGPATGELSYETQLDVCPGQLVADQVIASLDPGVDVAEIIRQLAFDTRFDRRGCLAYSRRVDF